MNSANLIHDEYFRQIRLYEKLGAVQMWNFELMDSKERFAQNEKNIFNRLISTSKNKKIVSKIGTSIAILLLTYSVLAIKLVFGNYGLIHSFPATFFIALSLLVLCSAILWNDPRKNNAILTIQFITFLAGIWLVPFICELVPSRTSYTGAGFVDYIVRYGTLNPEVAFYHNWPAFSVLNAILVNALGLTDLTKLMGLTPFFSNCFYFLALCLLRRFMSNQNLATLWWPMVWVFFIANYIGQDYFSPQGLAYFLFLLFVGLLFVSKETDGYASGSNGEILKLLLFLSITISHAVTSMITIAVIFALTFRREKWYNSFLITSIIILSAWTFYGSIVYFNGHILGIIHQALNFDSTLNNNVSLLGSNDALQVQKVSFYYTLVLLSLYALGWVTTRQGFAKNCFTMLGSVPLFLIFIPYGGEMKLRVILFSLLPIAFFSSSFFRNRRGLASYVFILFLILSIPLHIIIHYGGEEYNYVSSAELNAANFLSAKATHEFEIITENDPIFRQCDLERFAVILTSLSTLENGKFIGPWSKNKRQGAGPLL